MIARDDMDLSKGAFSQHLSGSTPRRERGGGGGGGVEIERESSGGGGRPSISVVGGTVQLCSIAIDSPPSVSFGRARSAPLSLGILRLLRKIPSPTAKQITIAQIIRNIYITTLFRLYSPAANK